MERPALATPSAQIVSPPPAPIVDSYADFADNLVRKGKARETEINRTRRLAAQTDDQPLPALLVKLGVVSERDAAEALAEVGGLPLVAAGDYPEASPLPEEIAPRFLKENRMVGLAARDDAYEVAVADPFDTQQLDALALACDKPVRARLGLPSEIERAIEQQLGSGKSLMGQLVDNFGGDEDIDEADVEHLKDLASEAPVIRMVNLIMQRAVEARASDIHVEPFEERLKVRFRVDGVLKEVEAPPVRSTAAVISRIKIMAKLNIAERRLPQDGRIMVRVQGKELDLRVSTVPTQHGESVVMRLLDREAVVFDFHTLGFTDGFLPQFMRVLDQPRDAGDGGIPGFACGNRGEEHILERDVKVGLHRVG